MDSLLQTTKYTIICHKLASKYTTENLLQTQLKICYKLTT